MNKEKLAIISSYNDLCGNASYTKSIFEGLSTYYDATVIPLNVELLRKKESACAKLHIQEICKQLQNFDCVNIQFEAGLFGSDLRSIKKRFFAIAKSSKRLVLTLHRFNGKEKYPGIHSFALSLLKLKLSRFLFAFKEVYSNNRYLGMYQSLVQFCKKRKIPILVHTPRDKQFIQIKYNHKFVFDHPICFYDQNKIQNLKQKYTKESFHEKFHLDGNKIYIGIFGFITKYKGHETIIKAMEFLPEQYELLIFGTQHPHSIKLNEEINEYIDHLLKLLDKKKLMHRVKFFGLINDDDFIKGLFGCDFTVMPYLEVNQGGSAIAALSLETESNTIFSHNHAFLELSKYAPNAFKMFTMGNYLELANVIRSYNKSDFAAYLKEYHQKYNIRTSMELYQKLLNRQF